jgi:IS30 family transposase
MGGPTERCIMSKILSDYANRSSRPWHDLVTRRLMVDDRRKKGLSLRAIATDLGVSYQTVLRDIQHNKLEMELGVRFADVTAARDSHGQGEKPGAL